VSHSHIALQHLISKIDSAEPRSKRATGPLWLPEFVDQVAELFEPFVDVGRVGFDKVKTKGRAAAPFEIRYQNGKGPETLLADAVIDATGTWFTPSPAGAGGLPAIGEAEAREHVAYGMPDVLGRERARYAGKVVAVLGAGHSAIGTLIDLTRLKEEAPTTEVVWLLRGNNPSAVGEAAEFSEANLTERDKLRPLANYGRINGRRRAPDGSRSCLPAPGRKRARGVRSDLRRQGRLVPVLTK
jgi:cation diffusion facilitator CzcD-associated flavoprotein CzcO